MTGNSKSSITSYIHALSSRFDLSLRASLNANLFSARKEEKHFLLPEAAKTLQKQQLARSDFPFLWSKPHIEEDRYISR
jgi:hypothetical protein